VVFLDNCRIGSCAFVQSCVLFKDCPAYRGAMKQIRQGKIRTLAAMCEALAEQPLQNEPGWNTLW